MFQHIKTVQANVKTWKRHRSSTPPSSAPSSSPQLPVPAITSSPSAKEDVPALPGPSILIPPSSSVAMATSRRFPWDFYVVELVGLFSKASGGKEQFALFHPGVTYKAQLLQEHTQQWKDKTKANCQAAIAAGKTEQGLWRYLINVEKKFGSTYCTTKNILQNIQRKKAKTRQ